MAILSLSGLSACGPLQQSFIGPITVTQGDCGAGFNGGHTTASLSLRGPEAQFAPDEGVVVLPGHIDAAGHVTAALTAPGADKKPFTQVFEGDRHGDTVSGTFATPRCRATADLRRS